MSISAWYRPSYGDRAQELNDGRVMNDIQNQLMPDERLLWQGVPPRGIRLQAMDALLIPFSVSLAGFAVFWNAMVWLPTPGGEEQWSFKLSGLLFLIAGAYFSIGRLFHDAAIRRQITYLVTDRRALIIRQKRSGITVRSFDLAHLPSLQLKETKNGGTISFVQKSWFGPRQPFDFGVPSMELDKFVGLDDARSVYQIIQGQAATRV